MSNPAPYRTVFVAGIPVHICEFMPWTVLDEPEPPRWFLFNSNGQPQELYVSNEKWATEEEVAKILANAKEWDEENPAELEAALVEYKRRQHAVDSKAGKGAHPQSQHPRQTEKVGKDSQRGSGQDRE